MAVLDAAIIVAAVVLCYLVIREPWNRLPSPMVVLGMLLLALSGLVWAYRNLPG